MELTEKTGNLGARKGNHYQAHLLMWMHLLAASDDDGLKNDSNYRLTTEMAAAGKFDDAVLSWTGENGNQQWLFVQVKHKMLFKLNQDHLFSPSGDFSMFKYLISIMDIERNSNFDGQKQYVIFTNGAVDESIEHWFENADHEAAIVLKFPKSKNPEPKFLRMKFENIVTQQKHDAKKEETNTNKAKGMDSNTVKDKKKTGIEQFYNQLIQYVNKDFKELVQVMKAIFIEGKSDVKTDLFMKYSCAIVGKILEIEGQFVKFTARFIEKIALDPVEERLWAEFFKHINTPEELTENMTTSKSNNKLIEALKSKKYKNNSLPPIIGMKDLVSVFGRFFFAVNQPNNDELKSIITDELESRHGFSIPDKDSRACFSSLGFIKLEKMIDDCIDSPNMDYLGKERLLEELQSAKSMVKNSKLDVHTEIFKTKMQNLRVEYEHFGFKNKLTNLLSEVPLAIITSTQRGWLTSIKLSQMLKKSQYRYFSFKQLNNSSTFKMLLDILEDRSSMYYLLLRDDGSEFDIERKLFKVLPPNTTLRLILLTNNQNRVSKFFKDEAIIQDTASQFWALTGESRCMLENRHIQFQGSEILFRDLRGYDQLSSLLLNEVLEKLILGELFTIGAKLPEVEAKHYIPRLIDIPDLNRSEGTKQDINEEQFLERLPAWNPWNEIVVLSSIPGMGKSTLCIKLAQLAKKQDQSQWILHIKLQDCLNHLNSYEIKDLDDAIDFLSTAVSYESNLEKSMFEIAVKSVSFMPYIFFDAFDALPHENIKQFTDLLKMLNGRAYVFVNTREHRQVLIPTIKRFFLKPIDKEDLRRYFTSFSSAGPLAVFIDKLLKKVESESLKLASNFIGTPLIASMLMEIYKPSLQSFRVTEHINNLSMNIDLLDILNLFERFFYSSFYRQNVKKFKNSNDRELGQTAIFYKAFERVHWFLGLNNLVGKKNLELIVSFKDNEEFQQQAHQLQSPIVEYYNKESYFIHKSFAEFSAAKYLFDYLMSMMNYQVEIMFVKARPSRMVSNENICQDLFSLYFQLLRDYPMVRKFFLLIIHRHFSESFLEKVDKMFHCMRPYPLMWACEEKSEEIISHLVGKDPTIVNDTMKSKDTALHYMASQNAFNVCSLFINSGSDVNARNENNETPLHRAASAGSLEVVQLLIDNKNVNKNPLDARKETPLHLAYYNGHTDVIRVLLDNGCGFSHFAALNEPTLGMEDEDWFALIAYNVDSNLSIDVIFDYLRRSFFNWRPTLLMTIRDNNLRIIEAMHRVGVNIFKVDDIGESTYSLVLKYDSPAVAEMLLNLNENHVELNFPLHQAVAAGADGCVSFLLSRYKKDVNTVNGQGMTPVDLAVKFKRPKILEILLEASALVNDNILHAAIETRRSNDISCLSLKCIDVLLKHGVNLNAIDEKERTPLHVALVLKDFLLVEMLLRHSVFTELYNMKLTLMSPNSVVPTEPSAFNVNGQNNEGQTVLHLACTLGHVSIVKDLIKLRADVNNMNKNQQTPLHLAATGGYWDIAQVLLENGANAKAVDCQDMTHLDLAAGSGHLHYVQGCLTHRPLIWHESNVRRICDIAKQNGHDWEAKLKAIMNRGPGGGPSCHYPCPW